VKESVMTTFKTLFQNLPRRTEDNILEFILHFDILRIKTPLFNLEDGKQFFFRMAGKYLNRLHELTMKKTNNLHFESVSLNVKYLLGYTSKNSISFTNLLK
jgi:hypothetical protein